MKRVLLYIDSLGQGGAERQLCGLAVALKNRGYTVKFITRYRNQFYEPLLREAHIDYELHEELNPELTRIFRFARLIRRFKPDAVISFLQSSNKASLLTRFFNRRSKYIVSERNFTHTVDFKVWLRFQIYRLADHVVCNSLTERENICRRAPYLAHKTLTIHNFVDCGHFKPLPHKRNETPVILTAARIAEQKNTLGYIRAIAMLKERGVKFRCKWIGMSILTKQYHEQAVRLVNELGVEDVFEMEGETDNILKEYQAADFFCLPSLFEGFPNVICEAMSCGLPTLCSRVCDNPAIVEDGVNGFLFDPTDIADMADKLQAALEMDQGAYAAMSAANRRLVEQRLPIEAFARSYINLIET